MDAKELIARRVAKMLHDGDFVNLGIGLPTEVSNYIPEGVEVFLQGENGMVGAGPAPKEGEPVDLEICNAGGKPITMVCGGCFFDSATSFSLIRGGHVDYTVLGAMQVDQEGNLANWVVPGGMVPGMGGAMDLVVGAKTVVVAMTHTQKGAPKIMTKCSLPLTAMHQVDYIVTELGFMKVTEKGIVVEELAEGVTKEQIQAATEAKLIFADNLKTMSV